jgi:cytochrome c-type biogenesis protein CcmH
LLVLFALVLTGPVGAATGPDEFLADPALEERARGLTKQLRCLVCANQSIDDSDADLAKDLRVIVRERIAAGATDGEIIDFVTARYGDYVLLKPPMRPETWGLWFGPALVLVLAASGLGWALLRRRRPAAAVPLSDAERRRLEELLAATDRPGR